MTVVTIMMLKVTIVMLVVVSIMVMLELMVLPVDMVAVQVTVMREKRAAASIMTSADTTCPISSSHPCSRLSAPLTPDHPRLPHNDTGSDPYPWR